jgi:hypothetical protein
MNIEATETPKYVKLSNLIQSDSNFDVCTYKFDYKRYRFQDVGKIHLRANTLKDVDIYLNIGRNLTDASKTIIP